MNILSHYVLSLIERQPGISGADIRKRMKGKIASAKVNLSLRLLMAEGRITAVSQPPENGQGRASKFYPKPPESLSGE